MWFKDRNFTVIGIYVSKFLSFSVSAFKSITFTITSHSISNTGWSRAPFNKLQTEHAIDREDFVYMGREGKSQH